MKTVGTSRPFFTILSPAPKEVDAIRELLTLCGGGRITWCKRSMTITPNNVEELKRLLHDAGPEGMK